MYAFLWVSTSFPFRFIPMTNKNAKLHIITVNKHVGPMVRMHTQKNCTRFLCLRMSAPRLLFLNNVVISDMLHGISNMR